MQIINEPNRVIIDESELPDDEESVSNGIILDVVYRGERDLTDEFLDLFDIDSHDYLVNDDIYQGTNMMRVVKRKSDGKLFGYQYWQGGGKYGEAYIEENGDEFGLETQYNDDWTKTIAGPYYVWQPVIPINIQGYVSEPRAK